MVRRIINLLILLSCFSANAQRYLAKDGVVSFFSETPLENIKAINSNLSAVYDSENDDLVFQLKISDFIFPIPLMQEHFNENYLESDIFPKSNFIGKVISVKNNIAFVDGYLEIHGKSNPLNIQGTLIREEKSVFISSNFIVRLVDFDIKIPKILMYKIAEEISVTVDINLTLIE